ncbi:MAG: NUDIX domain-containing protein [Halobacteriovoraceae bacterium]|nr:NUDIX domain-containing protein [Halobacteriovoraceae bacterium]
MVDNLSQKLSQTYSGNEDSWQSVALCLFVGKPYKSLFFIHRSRNMPTHKNQIAFVGGNKKEGELPLQAARREFEEELSISHNFLEFMGYLPVIQTIGNRKILPLAFGIEKQHLDGVVSNGEWDYAFLYPLKALQEKKYWSHGINHDRNPAFQILFFPMEPEKTLQIYPTDYSMQEFYLWGATARIAWNLFQDYDIVL